MQDYTILLIDYDPRSVRLIIDPLAKAGYRVQVAEDGLAGIEAFDSIRPDLALVEAMIPKKDGFEVCQTLKQSPHGMTTPVIAISSVYKGRKYRNRALHTYGCDEFMEKPICPDRLLETVNHFLRDRPASTAVLSEPEKAVAPAPKPAAAATPTAKVKPAAAPACEPSDAEAEISDHLDSILF